MPVTTDAELLRAYQETCWRVALPDGPVMVRLGESAPPELRRAGIITAWNPASVRASGAENQAANQLLRHALDVLGPRFFAAVAGEGEWEEPGFAVLDVGQAELVSLGERLGQNAIVWIDQRGFVSLIVTRSGFCGHRIGDTIGRSPLPDDPCSPRTA